METACGKPLEVCLQGLQRLEYRGYDSAGVALTAPGMDHVEVRKKAGRLANLIEDVERNPMPMATVGIGHTRWATNGVPNDINAHPHTSRDGKVAIIHNGIIENASQLRLDLQTEGYRFSSETDTEVAAKLLGKISEKIVEETGKPDLFKAVRRLARMLEGAFTILATDCRQPGIVVGARHDSPLVVGLGEGENFLGSDVAAFVAYTKRAMEIDQDQAVMVSADKVVVSDFMGNIVADPKTYTVDWDASAAEKGGWDSFMDKEIHEGPAAVQRTLLARTAISILTRSASTSMISRRSTRLSSSPAVPPPTRAWWPSTPSSIGCVFRWKWSLPTNSVIVIRFSPRARWWWPFRSPVKPWTR